MTRVKAIIPPDDAATLVGLAAIHAECFPRPWTAAELSQLLAEPAIIGLAADCDALKGFILCRIAADEAEILTLAVARAHRGQRIATALLATALEHLRAREVKTCLLEVAADNGPARALYARAGFVEVGRRNAYYPGLNGEAATDALVLSAYLGA